LSRGNSEELDKLYRDWRGRDPIVQPMLEDRGLAPAPTTSVPAKPSDSTATPPTAPPSPVTPPVKK
ncbi:MAG: hypothetical protein HOQ02_12395, partial [Lysobacter sp.]|nr:hypothetical protein [Lysobacter sp.]